MAEYRGIHNIDRFVVQTFEDNTGEVLVRIDKDRDRPKRTGNGARSTEYEWPVRLVTKECDCGLGTQGRHDVTHVDVPPVGAKCQSLNPFRAVNNSVSPFIRHFRMQEGVTGYAFLDLWLGLPPGQRIKNEWEVLRACGIKL